MNKSQLQAEISDLLGKAIELHEWTDLKLEANDCGQLEDINICLENVVDYLRKARRTMRTVIEDYEDNLTKKPEHIDKIELDDSIDIEEQDEDED
jgi:hypothetical protein